MKKITIVSGKIVKKIAKIKGGGSALPGLFMEKISPNFLQETLSKLPHGVVVVSGTNGKTTTTKMVVELLESQGLRVFTNKTGSNFVRGVASALLDEVKINGVVNADIAVLELDEAHAVHFVQKIKPKYSLLLNVMRDQLDRFGEIDYTAKLLQKIGENTTKKVILNSCDPLLSRAEFSKNFPSVATFGFAENLKSFFPSDDEIHGEKSLKTVKNSDFTLLNFSKNLADIKIGENHQKFNLEIGGIHNILNLTAAIGLVTEIMRSEELEIDFSKIKKAASEIRPAFGRGEKIKINGFEVEILLVKNPAGFRSNLKSVENSDSKIMITINDNYADGRDMSWLWDVDFSKIGGEVRAISGIRAYDMAVRLFHDGIEFSEDEIETEIKKILPEFLKLDGDKKIFATYTAMLEIRKYLSKIAKMEKIL